MEQVQDPVQSQALVLVALNLQVGIQRNKTGGGEAKFIYLENVAPECILSR
jgi:hypothetical protein